MHSTIQHHLHRAPTATRRARWHPYAQSTATNTTPTYPTPAATVVPPNPPVQKDTQKQKYALGLVAQAVKTLTEIWQDVPVAFPAAPLPHTHDARTDEPISNTNHISSSPTNNQLPSPESPSTRIRGRTNTLLTPTPSVSSIESGDAVPLKSFVHEVLRRSRTSGAVLQTALCYMEAVRAKMPVLLVQEDGRQKKVFELGERRDGASSSSSSSEDRIITLEEWEQQQFALSHEILTQTHKLNITEQGRVCSSNDDDRRFFAGFMSAAPNIRNINSLLQAPSADDSTPLVGNGDASHMRKSYDWRSGESFDSSSYSTQPNQFSDSNLSTKAAHTSGQHSFLVSETKPQDETAHIHSQTQGEDSSMVREFATSSSQTTFSTSSQTSFSGEHHGKQQVFDQVFVNVEGPPRFFGAAKGTICTQTGPVDRSTVGCHLNADANARVQFSTTATRLAATTTITPPVSGGNAPQAAKYKTPAAPLPALPSTPSPLLCPRRAFLAALILASKFQQDRCYSNRAWAKMSGLPAREIGRCERSLGDILQWRLWVGKANVRVPAILSGRDNPAIPLVPLVSTINEMLMSSASRPELKRGGSSGRTVVRTQSESAVVFGAAAQVPGYVAAPTACGGHAVPSTVSTVAATLSVPRFHPFGAPVPRLVPDLQQKMSVRENTRAGSLRRCVTMPSPEYPASNSSISLASSYEEGSSSSSILDTLPLTPPLSYSPGGSSTSSSSIYSPASPPSSTSSSSSSVVYHNHNHNHTHQHAAKVAAAAAAASSYELHYYHHHTWPEGLPLPISVPE